MNNDSLDDSQLNFLPHPDDGRVLDAALEALVSGASNVFIVGEYEFHIDACFLALYGELKLNPSLQLHRMMSPKVDDIVTLFNELLANLSIDEARNYEAEGRHIIIMPDFGPNAGKEWLACESLVNTFPGANVSMLAFSTLANHDSSDLRQLSIKSRNVVLRLSELNNESMENYLSECYERGVLSDLLPALTGSIWHEAALAMLGINTNELPKQSVSDYDDLMSSEQEGLSLEPLVVDTSSGDDDLEEASAEAVQHTWRSSLAAVCITLAAFSLVIVVAGLVHPPLWTSIEMVVSASLELANSLLKEANSLLEEAKSWLSTVMNQWNS